MTEEKKQKETEEKDVAENKDAETETDDIDEEKPVEEDLSKKTDINLKKTKDKKSKVPFFKNPKKRLIFIISLGLLLIILCGTGLYFMLYDKPITKIFDDNAKKDEAPKVELFESSLNGTMVDKASSERHPLAIIVENHPDARPQSGLSQADIIYEAIAEGGITRFMAIFGTKEAEKVGPVRSARTFFVDWAHGYNAFLAHVGGNMDALDKIRAEKTPDLDQFANSGSYWREYVAGLATEHTMYTSTVKLRETATNKQYSTANNFNSWKFKDDPVDKATLPEAQKVTVDFSSPQYAVSFTYDKATNSYKRSLAGKPHTDKLTKEQINPKNVIVMTVKRQAVVTRINEAGYSMTTTGSGKARIYMDGKETIGTWKKAATGDRELFYDANDQEIVFNRGQFWISVMPPEATVTVE